MVDDEIPGQSGEEAGGRKGLRRRNSGWQGREKEKTEVEQGWSMDGKSAEQERDQKMKSENG